MSSRQKYKHLHSHPHSHHTSSSVVQSTKTVYDRRSKTKKRKELSAASTEEQPLSKKCKLDSGKTLAAKTIQRFYCHHIRGFVNHEDLVHMDRFRNRGHMTFKHVVGENQVYRFHVDQIVGHIIASGKFNNPYTSHEFNNIELRRLTKLMKLSDPSFKIDLICNKNQVIRDAQERMNLRENIEYYESCLIGLYDHLFQNTVLVSRTFVTSDFVYCMRFWIITQLERDESLWCLYRLAPDQTHTLVSKLLQNMRLLLSCCMFNSLFKTFVTLLYDNLRTTYVKYLHLDMVAIVGAPVMLYPLEDSIDMPELEIFTESGDTDDEDADSQDESVTEEALEESDSESEFEPFLHS